MKGKKGFTLVEMIVVIAVIGILAAVLIPTFAGATENAKRGSVQAAADAYRKAYLALATSKGTACVYEGEKSEEQTDGSQINYSVYRAPFGPKEMAEFAGVEEYENLYLVYRRSGSAGTEEDKKTAVLLGFVYIDSAQGYYSYFNSEQDKFETLALVSIPPEISFDSTTDCEKIVANNYQNALVLPEYCYPEGGEE